MDIALLKSVPIPNKRNDLLKATALLTMLIDHIGYLFHPGEMLYRTIGRIAFPIFAYQVAIGFKKTHDRNRYASRLFLFGLISQIPYLWFNPELSFEWHRINIMFTLLYGVGILTLIERVGHFYRSFVERKEIGKLISTIMLSAIVLLGVLFPEYLYYQFQINMEYGTIGVLTVLLFYFFGESILPMALAYFVLSLGGAYYYAARWMSNVQYLSIWNSLGSANALWHDYMLSEQGLANLSGVFFQSRSMMAVPIIWLINQAVVIWDLKFSLNRYIGYWFYPVHISILLVILKLF